jgi:hypothetical protein
VTVEVKLLTPGSCAGTWFRFVRAGYALRVCGHAYSNIEIRTFTN